MRTPRRAPATGVLACAILAGCYASLVTGDADPPPEEAPDMARPADFGTPDVGRRDIGSPPAPVDLGRPDLAAELGPDPVDLGADLPADMPPDVPDLGPELRPDLMRCASQLCLLLVVPRSGTDGVSARTFVELYFNRSIDSESGTVTLRVPGAPDMVLRGTDDTTFAIGTNDLPRLRPGFEDEFAGAYRGDEGRVIGVRLTLPRPLPAGARVELAVDGGWETPVSRVAFEAATDPLAEAVFRVAE